MNKEGTAQESLSHNHNFDNRHLRLHMKSTAKSAKKVNPQTYSY